MILCWLTVHWDIENDYNWCENANLASVLLHHKGAIFGSLSWAVGKDSSESVEFLYLILVGKLIKVMRVIVHRYFSISSNPFSAAVFASDNFNLSRVKFHLACPLKWKFLLISLLGYSDWNLMPVQFLSRLWVHLWSFWYYTWTNNNYNPTISWISLRNCIHRRSSYLSFFFQ